MPATSTNPIKIKKSTISADSLRKGSSQETLGKVGGEESDTAKLARILRDTRKKVLVNQKKITLLKKIIQTQKSNLAEKLKSLDPEEKPASPLDGLLGIVRQIAGGVDSIKQTLIDQQDLHQEASDDARKEKEQKKRSFKEKALELGGKAFAGVKKIGEKILQPAKGIFGQIIEFLTGIILGKAVMELFKWFTDPENKKKVSAIFKFLKDWWPVLVAGIMAVVGPGVTFLAGLIALLAWGVPKIVNIVKQLFGFGPKIDEALKDVEKDAKKIGGDIGKSIQTQADQIPESPKDEVNQQIQPVEKAATETQKEAQNVPSAPSGMAGGGPVEKEEESGEVKGKKGIDKIPAMLTDGEFVMSKDAVNAYGVDTLAGMNAAAGGTNKPKQKQGMPAFEGGGPVGSPKPQQSGDLKEKNEDKGLFGGLFNRGKNDGGGKGSTQEKVDTKHKKDHSNMKVVTPRSGPPGAPGMDGAPGQAGQRGSGVLNIASKAANMFAPHLGIGDAIKSGPAGMLRQIAGKAFAPHMQMAQGMGQNVMNNPMVQQMMQMPAVQGLMGQVKESFAGSPLSKVAEGMFGKDTVNNILGSIGASGAPGAPGAPGSAGSAADGIDGAPGSAADGIDGAPGATPASIVGMAAADIKAGSPIMKSAKPPAGEGIKPLSSRSMSSTIAYDTDLMKAGAGALEAANVGLGANTKEVPVIDASKFISTNKLAVLGITI